LKPQALQQATYSTYIHLFSEIMNLSSRDGVCVFVKTERFQVRFSRCLENLARAEHHGYVVRYLGSGSDAILQTMGDDRFLILPAWLIKFLFYPQN
jgi:hypothetical protein